MSVIRKAAGNIGLRIGTFGNTEQYLAQFGAVNPSETLVKDTMSVVQNAVGEKLTYLGGQTVRPFSMGVRQLRVASIDIDTVISDIDTLKNLYQFCKQNGHQIFLHHTMTCFFAVINGLPISVHYKAVYDIDIDQYRDTVEFNSNGTRFRFIRPELLAALKSRRKTPSGRIRPKDAIDMGNLILSARAGKIEFDKRRHQNDIQRIPGSVRISDLQETIMERDNFQPQEIKKIKGFFYKI